MIKDSDIQTQVEYYLSDANLQRDQFFYQKIQDGKDGFVDIGFILNCNKIKSLGVTKEQIVAAIKNSGEVEADEKGEHIRRKGNKALPEAKFHEKKTKTNGKTGGGKLLK